MTGTHQLVGQRLPKHRCARQGDTGRIRDTGDSRLRGFPVGAIKRSWHARILWIDTSAARALPG